ncbi:MAG: type II toxin-antitoxin system RelE/ParE family toxin [Oscillospiraceae bacterium]|nr:type II toxin-antitoxin system RelE/ParE family toxin [Oscillospiraceae bacterium]
MEFRIKYSEYAVSDLDDISEYLNQFYERTLERFLTAYEERVSILTRNPYAFRVCPYNTRYRQMPVTDYVVIYKVIEATGEVKVYRVLHG